MHQAPIDPASEGGGSANPDGGGIGGSIEESEAGLQGTGSGPRWDDQAPEHETDQRGEIGDNGRQDQEATPQPSGDSREEAGDGVAENRPNPNKNRVVRPERGRRAVSDLELGIALKEANGDRNIVAKVFGMQRAQVNQRIKKSARLAAIYSDRRYQADANEGLHMPNEIDTITRTPASLPAMIEGSERAEAIMAQDREILRSGLAAAGIKKETIDKIRSLDGLAANSGRMVSASLDYTHRLHIWSTAALFEEMMYIRDNHLRKDGQDPMVTIFWQRAFNEIADLLGKSNDRTMNTATALAAMMKNQSGNKPGATGAQKAKPGW